MMDDNDFTRDDGNFGLQADKVLLALAKHEYKLNTVMSLLKCYEHELSSNVQDCVSTALKAIDEMTDDDAEHSIAASDRVTFDLLLELRSHLQRLSAGIEETADIVSSVYGCIDTELLPMLEECHREMLADYATATYRVHDLGLDLDSLLSSNDLLDKCDVIESLVNDRLLLVARKVITLIDDTVAVLKRFNADRDSAQSQLIKALVQDCEPVLHDMADNLLPGLACVNVDTRDELSALCDDLTVTDAQREHAELQH